MVWKNAIRKKEYGVGELNYFKRRNYTSLRSVASVSVWFRGEERSSENWNESQATCAILRAVFDSRPSFFAPKPHGNACYAGYNSTKYVNGTVY